MQLPLDGTVLITGASAGIGRALATCFASRASTIILVARRENLLNELRAQLIGAHPSLRVLVLCCDLSDGEARERLLSRLQSEADPIDILVNNAGFGDQSFFEGSSWTKLERMLHLNVIALTHLTRRLLPSMISRRRGGILNISSVFGVSYLPGLATYIGSKHYVTGFTDTLRAELSGTGVGITQICPGPVATEFPEVAANTTGMPTPEFMVISAEQCAMESYRGFSRGRAIVFPGFVNRRLAQFSSLSPRWANRLIQQFIARKMRVAIERSSSANSNIG